MARMPVLVVTTLATREQTLALAHDLVGRRLAACAQITAIDSVYRWQGAIEQDVEFRLLLKTHAGGYAALEEAIRAQHPYELPAIHAIATAKAYAPYAEWVEASTQGAPGADWPPHDAGA
jgi:periplasmic divalent cation tolerance protein